MSVSDGGRSQATRSQATPGGPTASEPTGGEASGNRCLLLRVGEMDCPDCARRVQDRLRRLEGIERSEGNPVSRRLRVVYDPGRLSPDRIREEVGRLGYAAEPVDDADGDPGAGIEAPRTWTSRAARWTYAAAALFVTAVALEFVGPDPALLSLPLEELRLSGLLFVVAAAVGARNFLPAGLRAARALSLDMNFLMTVAVAGAAGVGQYLEAGAIAVLFSLAELLESHSVDRARGSIRSLMELSPDTATVLRDGEEVRIPAAEIEAGDEVVVRPGERIPADGAVVEGASDVDQSPITGESMPVTRERGDQVYAGTINGDGFLRVRTDRPARDTTLARIIRLVEEAESRKAPSERFVERFARWYTPAVTAAAVLLAAVPPAFLGEPFVPWFVRGLTLLVVACPCAMVISTPVAVVSGITAAARNGVLIKGGVHLEAMGQVGVVAFDKTGTLTAGHPRVTDVEGLGEVGPEDVLRVAAAVEGRSEHPVARALMREARSRELDPGSGWRVDGFETVRGLGVRAELDGTEYRVGRPDLFSPDAVAAAGDLSRFRREGKTAVLVGTEERVLGLVAVADRARAEAREALEALRRAGIRRLVMLTGDNAETADAVAEELGFDEVHAGLLPHQKVERIQELEQRYGPVAMVGDGVNDGPALAAATVGIAMGVAGTDTALETGDVALMGDDLSRLAYLVRLSRSGRRVIRQNVLASIGVKGMLAAAVPFGLVSLVVAVLVGDMGASLGVTGNSMRLARIRPEAASAA